MNLSRYRHHHGFSNFNCLFAAVLAIIGICTVAGCSSENAVQSEQPHIPFTVGEYVNIGYRYGEAQDTDFSAQVIHSNEQLQECFQQEKLNNDMVERQEDLDYTQKYEDEFFHEKAIILMSQNHPSGSMRDQINFLSRSGQQLIIDYTTISPFFQTADMAGWRILLEVNKADVEGITEIVPQQHEEHLGEGEDIDAMLVP